MPSSIPVEHVATRAAVLLVAAGAYAIGHPHSTARPAAPIGPAGSSA
jgi:hypothetical protein